MSKKLLTEIPARWMASTAPPALPLLPQIPAPAPPSDPLLWPDSDDLALEDPFEVLEMDWLLPGFIERPDAVVWSGDPGVGKSLILTAISMAFCAGTSALDFFEPLETPRRVALLDLENRPTVLKRRVIRIAMGLGLDYKPLIDPSNGTFVPFSLRGRRPFGPTETSQTIKLLSAAKPDLFILDTIMIS